MEQIQVPSPLTFAIQDGKIAIQSNGRGIMDEQDLVSLLKEHGWTYTRRVRGHKGKQYAYAQKREDTDIVERYIAPLTKLNQYTPEQIIAKLENSSPKTETATKHRSLCKSHCLVA